MHTSFYLIFLFFVLETFALGSLQVNESYQVTQDSIEFTVTFDQVGFIYGVILDGTSETPSVDVMKASVHKVQVVANEPSTILFSTLLPATTYDVYFYAETEDSTAMDTSIEATKQTVETSSNAETLTIQFVSITSNSNSITVNFKSNLNCVLYCQAFTDSTIPTKTTLLESNFTSTMTANVTSECIINELTSNTEYNIYCFAKSDTLEMTNTIESTKQVVSTESTSSIQLTIKNVSATHNSISIISVLSINGKVWCISNTENIVPSVDTIKETSSITVLKDTDNTSILFGLVASTMYHLYCYAEDMNEHAMTTTIADTYRNITTSEEPAVGPTLSFTTKNITDTTITASVTLSTNGHIWCRTLRSNPATPDVSYIRESSFNANTTADVATDIDITGLEAGLNYDLYCYGENEDGIAMQTTLESIKYTFTTTGGVDVILTMGDISIQGQIMSISLTLSVSGSAWCAIYDKNAEVPTASSIQSQNHVISMIAEEPKTLSISDISVGDHDMYCYAKSQQDQAMKMTIEETKRSITISAAKCNKDCGFGKCDDSTKKCICFNGFTLDENDLCTVEGNTYRILIPFTNTVDISTSETRKAFETQVIADIALSLHLSTSRFTPIFVVPSPLTISVDMKPVKGSYLSTQAYIWQLQSLEKNSTSTLYKGVYTQYINKQKGMSYTSVYHCDSDVILTPNVINYNVENTPEALSVLINGTFKISSSTASHNMFLYNYERIGENMDWLNIIDAPTTVSYEGTVASYSINPSQAKPGMNVVNIVVHSLYGDSSMITFILTVGTVAGEGTCDDLSGYSGFDFVVALFTTISFLPGLIGGLAITLILVIIIIICICCCCRRKTKKAGASRPKNNSTHDAKSSSIEVDDSKYQHEVQLTIPSELSQADYQTKWSQYASQATWEQQIRGIPKEGKLEDMLKKSEVYCSSSTFMTNTNKYHFYGQDEESNEFILADISIERATKHLTIVVKGPHDNFTNDFISILQKKLARLAPQ